MVAQSKCIKLSDPETIRKFNTIKEFLGLQNDSEVLRFLINWYLRKGEVIKNV